MSELRFVNAIREDHFRAMSLIHALGWRDTYADCLPADYMSREITNERWVKFFREDYETGRCHGLLLYRDEIPVACVNYGPARTDNYNAGSICTFDSSAYRSWGEIISFYAHPAERGKGYGGLLFEEALRRLHSNGYQNIFVFVLRENQRARKFYADHGFFWDGTQADIPFPPDTVCVDLRYVNGPDAKRAELIPGELVYE